MTKLKNNEGAKSGSTRTAASLEATAEPDRIAGILAEIDRLMEGFDDRLALVDRCLDRVLERRA